MGAAYGTARSGVGISSMGVMRPDLVMKSIIPVIMAGVLGIYGLIISIVITGNCIFTLTKTPITHPTTLFLTICTILNHLHYFQPLCTSN